MRGKLSKNTTVKTARFAYSTLTSFATANSSGPLAVSHAEWGCAVATLSVEKGNVP